MVRITPSVTGISKPLYNSVKNATRSARSQPLPKSRNLPDVADWYWQRMPDEDKKRLTSAMQVAADRQMPLRFGTLCSGTDVPVPVLKCLVAGIGRWMGIHISMSHVFSCESDTAKRGWIIANFPDMEYLFTDVVDVGTGWATDALTCTRVRVPAVDILIAGFVCKSVSCENKHRDTSSSCIDDVTGSTGITFNGVWQYVKLMRPALVICENVEGIVKRIGGRPPPIHAVMKSWTSIGYTSSWKLVDSRYYALPHRRHRVWIWAFRGDARMHCVQQVPLTLDALASTHHLSLDATLTPGRGCVKVLGDQRMSGIGRRERTVVQTVWHDHPELKGRDIIIDLKSSITRGIPFSCDSSCCILPTSKMYRVLERRLLSTRDRMSLQGIYRSDFPALDSYLRTSGTKCLLNDLAGNAFSSTVYMAVMLACLGHTSLGASHTVQARPAGHHVSNKRRRMST